MSKKKTIMRTFKIAEISAVDRPAQGGARALLMKRGGDIVDDDLDINKATKTEDGKEFSASDYAYVPDASQPSTWKLRLTGTPGGKPDSGHVGAAAAALGAGFRGNKVELPSGARSGVVARVRRAWKELNPGKDESDMPEGLSKSYPENLNLTETDMTKEEIEALQKAAKDAKDALAAKDAELAKAKKVSDLTDAEKKKYNSMSDADKDDFLNKSADERAAIIKNDADANPVVYKADSGEEFRKNDDPRLVRMAKQSDEDRKIAKQEREARELSDLKKRATTEFSNLPGTEDEKAAMLKAIEGISDENLRKKALESVKAGNNAMSAAFTRKGANGGDNAALGNTATDKLDELAKKHASEHKVSYAKAYDAVMQTEEGSALYAESLKK